MANYFGRIWRGAMLFAGSGATLAMVAMSYDDDRGAENANNLRASTQWDDNWDRRAPPPDAADSTDGDKPTKATASRHLILIRHGQYDHRYDLAHKPDELRVLTQLGHQQATITGKRLKELQAATGSGYNALIHSSLKRAIETTIDIIPSLEVVPPVSSCDLLIEGLPCKPDPGQPVSWKNRHVSNSNLVSHGQTTIFLHNTYQLKNISACFEIAVWLRELVVKLLSVFCLL